MQQITVGTVVSPSRTEPVFDSYSQISNRPKGPTSVCKIVRQHLYWWLLEICLHLLGLFWRQLGAIAANVVIRQSGHATMGVSINFRLAIPLLYQTYSICLLEEVQANSEFEVLIPEQVTQTQPPSSDERRVLREIDPTGMVLDK